MNDKKEIIEEIQSGLDEYANKNDISERCIHLIFYHNIDKASLILNKAQKEIIVDHEKHETMLKSQKPCPRCGEQSLGYYTTEPENAGGRNAGKWAGMECGCETKSREVFTNGDNSINAPWRLKAIDEWNKWV